MRAPRALLLLAVACSALALASAFDGDFANPGGPPDGVGAYIQETSTMTSMWIQGLETFSGSSWAAPKSKIVSTRLSRGEPSIHNEDNILFGPTPTFGTMHSWECDPDNGPGAYKIAETFDEFHPNGTLLSSVRVCAMCKLDLEAGILLSAIGWDGGPCPVEYLPEPAILLENTLHPTELTCK